MKIKKYIDFINEHKDEKILLKHMNNKDRKSLQEFYNILKITKIEDLPPYIMKFEGDLDNKIASYIYDPVKHKEFLDKYIMTDDNPNYTLLKLVQQYNMSWDDRHIYSDDVVVCAKSNIVDELLDINMMDNHTKEIYFLTDEEERALPSLKTIKKYNL